MNKTFSTKETANAALVGIYNKLTKRYMDTAGWYKDGYIIDVYAEEWENYNNVQVSLETEDNLYYVVQGSYDNDTGEMFMNIIFDGLVVESFELDIDNGIPVDGIADMMAYTFEQMVIRCVGEIFTYADEE